MIHSRSKRAARDIGSVGHGCLGRIAHLMGMSEESAKWGLEPLLGVSDLAEYLGMPISTVYDWRRNGLGPPGYRFGKHVKFAVSDVSAWLQNQRDTLPPKSATVPGGGL
jgi:excisionase family DNA binding protein